jgi:hypothetical protein
MLIFYGGMVTGFLSFVVRPPLRRVLCLPFYRVKRRQRRQGCLRSEVLSRHCSNVCREWLAIPGHHGDVEDEMMKRL